MYEEAARRALAHEGADSFGAAVEGLLALDDQRWRRLVDLIAEMLPGRDRWLPLLAGRLQAASALDEAQLRRVRQHFDEDLQLLVHAYAAQRLRGAWAASASRRSSPLLRAAAQRLGNVQADLAQWRSDQTALRPEPRNTPGAGAAWPPVPDQGRRTARTAHQDRGVPAAMRGESDDAGAAGRTRANRPGAQQALVEVRALPEPRYGDEDWKRVRDVAQVLVLAAAELERGVSRAGRRRLSRRVDRRAAGARHPRRPRPISACGSIIGCSTSCSTSSRTPRARSSNCCGC